MQLWTLLLVLATSNLICAQNSFTITSDDNQTKVYDVIIVGGGLTGLTAARKILAQRPQTNVLILEARGQVGGRVRARTVSTANGDEWLDLGSQFISPKHSQLINLIRGYNVQLAQQSACGHNTVLIEGVRRRRDIWTSSIPRRSSFDDVIRSADASRLSNMTIGDFTLSSGMSSQEAAAMNRLLQTFYDSPEDKISPLTVSLTAGSDKASVADLLLDFGHGNSFLAVGGMYNIVQNMADGLDIHYNEYVTSINHENNSAIVNTQTSKFYGKQVLVTAPPAVAANITFTPSLDTSFQSFLESYAPKGTAYYFTMTFPTAFWRDQARSGQIIYTSSTGKIAWLTTFDVTPNQHCVSSTGTTGIIWGIAHLIEPTQSEEERQKLYIEVIKKTLGSSVTPIDVKDVQFSSDPTAFGSVGAFAPLDDITFLQYLNGLHSESNSLHFASAELSNTSMGMMNGAVISGTLAGQLLSELVSNSNVVPSFQYDQPIQQVVSASNQTSSQFVYKTSTHYPPTSTINPLAINIILAPASFVKNGTGFQYSTSTHYPILQTESTEVKRTMESVQRDQSVTAFNYETSSQYPPTEAFETTTMVHFSMGNLQTQEVKQRDETNSFVYKTSTHYPPFEQTTISPNWKHFSLGNLDDEPRTPIQSVVVAPAQSLNSQTVSTSPPTTTTAQRVIVTGSTQAFEYRTSSPYPVPNVIQTNDFQHFSLGNLDSANNNDLTKLVVAKDQASAPTTQTQVAVQSVPSNILTELQQVTNDAANGNQLTLATKLSAIVKNLLESINFF